MAGFVHLGHGQEIATQTVAAGAARAKAANPFSAQTRQVCIAANTACHYAIGDSSVAASTSTTLLPANTPKYVTVAPGQKHCGDRGGNPARPIAAPDRTIRRDQEDMLIEPTEREAREHAA
jgi:hypothetical protein